MKVLFLVSGRAEVSVRFRVLQFLPYFRRRGIVADVQDLHAPVRQRWSALSTARSADAVVVHRAFLSPLELALLRRSARRWIFDFDDAIMFRDSAAVRQPSWQRRARFARMVRAADAVVAGNAYLAAQAQRYRGQVSIVPTAVDPADYPHQATLAGDPVVGWIGTRINLMYLRAIAPALRRIAEQYPRMSLRIVSDDAIEIPGVRVETRAWNADREAADLAGFHVGIMPLTEDPWTRGKCGVKLLQYMAAGVPVVCSPVGANAEIVTDGVNGYHARTEDEWVEHVVALLDDGQTCRQFARAGRETVQRRYGVEAQLEQLLALL